MGNIHNLWYIKGQGGDWASNKCQLDDCYSIPYKNGDTRYLQVAVSSDYTINRIWFCDMEGNRLYTVTTITDDYNITAGDEYTYVSFLMPTLGEGSCPTMVEPQAVCFVDIGAYIDLIGGDFVTWWSDYKAGLNDTDVTIEYNGGTAYNMPSLPPEMQATADPDVFILPCPPDGAINVDIVLKFYVNGFGVGETDIIPIAYVSGGTIDVTVSYPCFYFEIPLLIDDVEVAILTSEPFQCGGCGETLEIEGDYCLSTNDIYGPMVFDLTALSGAVSGGLTEITNKQRIQAVIKKLPPQKSQSRNLRCNNFKSKLIERYKIQGAFPTDFPPYMGDEIESVFSAKKLYINGVEYIPTGESAFGERGVNGRSMWKLDAELQKCEKTVVYDCSCVIPPPNCDENPVTGFMLILPATEITDQDNGVNRVYIYAESIVTGGVGTLTFSNWNVPNGNATPVLADVAGTDILAFDDTRNFNWFERTDYAPCSGCLAILMDITDERGCVYVGGNNVDMDDLRCVEDLGNFEISELSSTTVKVTVTGYPTAGVPIEYRLNAGLYIDSGEVTGGSPFVIGGLTANTEYSLYINLSCDDTMQGIIGPIIFTTLP